jgi:DNA-binding transcriptional LysR family regulator
MKPHLTEAGRRLLKHAESVLATVDRIPEEMEEIKGLKKGSIRVGGAGLSASFLPLAVQTFTKKHPGIEVTLFLDQSRNLQDRLLEGDLDIAILSFVPRSQSLIDELYAEEEVIAIASPKHPLAKKRVVQLERLAKEPLIVYQRGGLMYDMIEKRFAESGVPFRPRLEVKAFTSAREGVKSAVASGLGIGLTARRHAIGDVKSGRLKILRIPDLNLKRRMYIAYHKKKKDFTFLQEFKEFLKSKKKW